jgi:hypothetical protein
LVIMHGLIIQTGKKRFSKIETERVSTNLRNGFAVGAETWKGSGFRLDVG